MTTQTLKFLTSFDLFGEVVPLQVNNNNKLRTLTGFIVTLIVGVLGFSFFTVLVKDMSEKQNPDVYEHTQQTMGTFEGFTFQPKEFVNTVTLADSNYVPILNTIQKTYFIVKFRFCEGNDNCWFVNSENCPQSMADEYHEKFQINKTVAKLSYCLNQTYWSTQQINLKGSYLSIDYTRVEILVEKCVNSTTNDFICASNLEIQDKLNHSYIVYGIQDFEFNRNDYENPFQRSFQYFTQSVYFESPQTAYIKYELSEVTSIENDFFLWPKTRTHKAVQYIDQFVDISRVDSTVLGKSIYALSSKLNFKSRVYKNILSVFGTIGGLMSLIIHSAKVFMIPFNWLALKIYLLEAFERRMKGNANQLTISQQIRTSIWQLIKIPSMRQAFFEQSNDALSSLEVQDVINAISYFKLKMMKNIDKTINLQQSKHDCYSPHVSPGRHLGSKASLVPGDPQAQLLMSRTLNNLITRNRLQTRCQGDIYQVK